MSLTHGWLYLCRLNVCLFVPALTHLLQAHAFGFEGQGEGESEGGWRWEWREGRSLAAFWQQPPTTCTPITR